MLKQLLNRNFSKRLISIPDIKKSKFFSSIDWDKYLKKDFDPIYKPIIVH